MAKFLARPDSELATYADGNARDLIAQVLAVRPDAIVDAGVHLLRAMACTTIKSMTETEFNSLLAHAAHRERINCPGWRPKSYASGGEQEYGKLHRCLSEDNQVRAAPPVQGLLNALADQMAALIGEYLTFLEFRRASRPMLTNESSCGVSRHS